MKLITENWYVIVALLCACICVVDLITRFISEPKETKIASVKQWLLWAVTECEKQLGSGTGALKLRLCWSMAIEKFPWIASVISFDTFSGWVDEALDWMKVQLESNKAAKEYVEGDNNGI